MTRRQKLLGQILKEMKLVTEGQIQAALREQRERGGAIGEILIRMGHITRSDLNRALGIQQGMEVVDLARTPPSKEALSKVEATQAAVFQVVPFRIDNGTLHVAMADPMNTAILDDIAFSTGLEVRGAIADPRAVQETIERVYGRAEERMGAIVEEIHKAQAATGPLDLADKEAMARSAPVVRLLNYVLFQAIRDKASDVHLEPFENDFKIRYRVDGVLYELEAPPPHLATALISRVKVMADLDIAETRLPQDGRIELSIGGKPVDLRVSTLPTMFGESCVLRILDRSVVSLDLAKVGLRGADLELTRQLIRKPHGILLVTGPTGSGKTTTLYSALGEINEVGVKIITTEDPVEYDIDGIVQIQIQEEIGVTYARCLRTILRQDPDKILVGEIRDLETAQIAVEASLTGHMVFSTLHTNDAPSAITRLVDIGIEPYLITTTVEAILAQRLVRRICDRCKEPYAVGDEVVEALGLSREEVGDKEFAYGKGCENCNYSGYKGRMGIFEILVMNEPIRQLVLDGASTGRIRQAALEGGMRTLRQSGLLAIYDGLTTVEEVLRETAR